MSSKKSVDRIRPGVYASDEKRGNTVKIISEYPDETVYGIWLVQNVDDDELYLQFTHYLTDFYYYGD